MYYCTSSSIFTKGNDNVYLLSPSIPTKHSRTHERCAILGYLFRSYVYTLVSSVLFYFITLYDIRVRVFRNTIGITSDVHVSLTLNLRNAHWSHYRYDTV